MTVKLLTLLILFQIKHFLADFPLQNEYTLGKFKEKDLILHLFCHSSVHAIITLLISSCFTSFNVSMLLGIMDFIIHFTMDRIKASPKLLGKYKSLCSHNFQDATDLDKENNKRFWWCLGLDQMVHHLTHYIIIGVLL